SVPLFFTSTATPELYTLSLHDALPIFGHGVGHLQGDEDRLAVGDDGAVIALALDVGLADGDDVVLVGHLALGVVEHLALEDDDRSEEHTSELQSRENLVCRLLLEKKNK